MEINQDVLLGKKNTNCLSCNNGRDTMDKFMSTKGKDGRIYFGVVDRFHTSSFQHRKTQDNNSETTKVYVDFNMNSGRVQHSPLQKSGGSPKDEKGGLFDLIDDRSATMNKQTNNHSNSSLTQLERYNRSYKNRQTSNMMKKMEKSYGSSSRQLNLHNHANAQGHHARSKKHRLPISYVVQDQMRNTKHFAEPVKSLINEFTTVKKNRPRTSKVNYGSSKHSQSETLGPFGNILNKNKVSMGNIAHSTNQMSFVNIMSGENQLDNMSRMHGNQTILNNMALLAAAEAGGGNTTLSNHELDKNYQ